MFQNIVIEQEHIAWLVGRDGQLVNKPYFGKTTVNQLVERMDHHTGARSEAPMRKRESSTIDHTDDPLSYGK